MADISTATGWKFYIGTTLAADTETEFVSDTYTEVGLVESLGAFGDSAARINFAALGDSRVRKAKGARDAGTMAVTCGHDPLDTGQIAMTAAQLTNNKYNFKVVGNDSPSGGTDSVFYFRGLVSQARLNVGANDNVVRREYEVDIDTEVLEILAVS
jgi:hypothetical protein